MIKVEFTYSWSFGLNANEHVKGLCLELVWRGHTLAERERVWSHAHTMLVQDSQNLVVPTSMRLWLPTFCT